MNVEPNKPGAMSQYQAEEQRIKDFYSKRDISEKSFIYSWKDPSALYIEYRKKYYWIKAFRYASINNFSAMEVLDVGCGTGTWLRMLMEWGVPAHKLHGVDLLEDRISMARSISPPETGLRVSNSWPLPYSDDSMDLCSASTVFSSVLNEDARRTLGKEMERVVKPRGWIMVFDYAFSSPGNKNTSGINKNEICRIFSGLKYIRSYWFIFPPPILRIIPQNLLWVAHALECFLPFFCTHRLYLLRKI